MKICPDCGRNIGDRAACVSCPTAPEEHRGSRMPELLESLKVDPLFADAAFREFTPEQEAMLREKAAGGAR